MSENETSATNQEAVVTTANPELVTDGAGEDAKPVGDKSRKAAGARKSGKGDEPSGTALATVNTQALAVPGTRLTRTGLIFERELKHEEWDAALNAYSIAGDAIQWAVGDLLVYGESRDWGEKYDAAIERTGKDYGTLANWAWVCGAITPERRRPELDFGHHEAVAGLSSVATQNRLLEKAVKGKKVGDRQVRLSVDDLRLLVREEKQKARVKAAQAEEEHQPVGEPDIYHALAGSASYPLMVDLIVSRPLVQLYGTNELIEMIPEGSAEVIGQIEPEAATEAAPPTEAAAADSGTEAEAEEPEAVDVDLEGFHSNWMTPAFNALKDGGVAVVFCEDAATMSVVGYLAMNMGCTILRDVVWQKPSSRHELILFIGKGEAAALPEAGTAGKDFWTDKPVNNYGHAGELPVEMVERIITMASQPKDIVADPFANVGTVPAVAKSLKRKFWAAEADEQFYRIAVNRVRKTKAGSAVAE